MAHDEFNSGARHGFSMALLAVRDIDRKISDHKGEDIYKVGKSNLYNIRKDFLHEIYEAIMKERDGETYDE
jgi:hypothetical protein